jgi:hypothetical protein
MRGSVLARTAKINEALVYYDEPQLLLLTSDRDVQMIAVAVRRSGMQRPFFSCEVRDKIFDRYLDGRADLHYVFKEARREMYYFFDLENETDGWVSLRKATDAEVQDDTYWPKIGFFSRSHTIQYQLRPVFEDSLQEYKIDGNWEARDFSQFHGKISDLYALFSVLNRLDAKQPISERELMKRCIRDRFWQGGGSYVGFYDDLFSHVKSISPLSVARIQYASPGSFALRGNKDALYDITQMIETFDLHQDDLDSSYREVYRILRKEQLLRAEKSSSFSSKAIEGFVRTRTFEFVKNMKIERANEIFEACDEIVLIFAKVVLSIFRRGNELYSFHAQGRVQPGRHSIR